MNKRMLPVACIAILLGGSMLHATTSQFRSPLTFTERGYEHYPLPPIEDTYWYEDTGHDRNETDWSVNVFKGLYGRSANKSFFDPCDKPCSNGSTTRDTASLSQLWFGADSFRAEQAYAGGTIANTTTLNCEDIALAFAQISPRFDYNEYGAYVGLHTERKLGKNGNWRVGGRISMPVKVIEVELDQTCKLAETLDDVVKVCPINLNTDPGANEVDFAARLDFLTALSIADGVNQADPFVTYDDGTFETTMASDYLVSGDNANIAKVYTIASNNGCLPKYPFRKNPTNVSISALPANGSSADGSISFFQSDTNYEAGVGQSRDAQGRLFVVPQKNPADTLPGNANIVSQNLQTQLNFIALSGGLKSPIDILKGCTNGSRPKPGCGNPCAIDLCSAERITGQGDLDTEIYGGYAGNRWFTNLALGLKLPTGAKAKDARRVYYQTTGNNGHFEVKARLEGGWRPYDWFGFQLDGSYSYALKRNEKRAAPFKGATVRNIGPEICADVSWGYFVGHADFTFFHPHNPELGCSFGYELFAKGKDHVSVDCKKTVKDCLGVDGTLDACVLERRTNSMTHKLRTEVFHRWEFCELVAGASQVLAGKNAMKETEAHVGLVIYF